MDRTLPKRRQHIITKKIPTKPYFKIGHGVVLSNQPNEIIGFVESVSRGIPQVTKKEYGHITSRYLNPGDLSHPLFTVPVKLEFEVTAINGQYRAACPSLGIYNDADTAYQAILNTQVACRGFLSHFFATWNLLREQ